MFSIKPSRPDHSLRFSGRFALRAVPPNSGRKAVTRALCTLTLTALLFALLASPAQAQLFKRDKPYADGSTIQITGIVSDLQGNPVPDMTVELIAKRLKRLNGAVVREVSVETTTNERGEYSFDWVWYRYYNDFLLEASLAVPTGTNSTRNEVVAQTKLNNRIELGSPVIVPITVTESEFLETFRGFLESLDTDDERRVYDTQGRPAKVDVFERPDRVEEAWWYFDRGNVYRFVDGRLDQVESFDPIGPVDQ